MDGWDILGISPALADQGDIGASKNDTRRSVATVGATSGVTGFGTIIGGTLYRAGNSNFFKNPFVRHNKATQYLTKIKSTHHMD